MLATDSYIAELLKKLGASDFTIRTADFLVNHVLKIAVMVVGAAVNSVIDGSGLLTPLTKVTDAG